MELKSKIAIAFQDSFEPGNDKSGALKYSYLPLVDASSKRRGWTWHIETVAMRYESKARSSVDII